MEKCQFDCLNKSEKIGVLYHDGVFIGKLTHDGVISMLYQLHTFYVEIYYKTYRHSVLKLESYSSPSIIDKYFPETGIESFKVIK